MKTKKWLGSSPCYSRRFGSCPRKLRKESGQATTIKIATVNRSGSEEKRWDKIQEVG